MKFLTRLEKSLIRGNKFVLHHIAEHRFALQITGENLSYRITDNDPHYDNMKVRTISAKEENSDSIRTAKIVNEYVHQINSVLKEKYYKGLSKSNSILLRSPSRLPSFFNINERYHLSSSCCIANNALYNGVGRLFGMNVVIKERYMNYMDYYNHIPELVTSELKVNDFVFLHIQEPDLLVKMVTLSEKKPLSRALIKPFIFLNI